MLLFGITYGFDWYARVLRLACGAAFLLLPLIQLLHLEGEDGVSEGEEGDTACGEAAAFARWSAALRVWYISVVASPPYWLTHSLIMAGLLTRRLLRAREGYSPPPISASSSDLDALKAELHSFDSSHLENFLSRPRGTAFGSLSKPLGAEKRCCCAATAWAARRSSRCQ